MSCGTCGQGTPADQAAGAAHAAATRQRQGEIDAGRVMCLTCPDRRGAAWATKDRPLGTCRAAIALTRDGVPVAGQPLGLIIAGVKSCPRGRHPDTTGRVRWMGIDWLGVPMPLRLAARAMGRKRGGIDHLGALPGCGCIARLKGWVSKLASTTGTA